MYVKQTIAKFNTTVQLINHDYGTRLRFCSNCIEYRISIHLENYIDMPEDVNA